MENAKIQGMATLHFESRIVNRLENVCALQVLRV
jgi:hypothetical protein